MSPDRLSGLKIYSLGIVVQDKQEGSDQVIVYPVEELPTVYGDISKMQQNKASLPNAQGSVKTSQAQSQNTLVATWIPFGHSNRMTSPDVVKNETILIFRFADTSEYYWTTIFREPSLRRTETVIYAFGNIPTDMTAFDSSTSYWFKVDTKNQIVQMHTAANNGEACGYDVIVNTAQGTYTLEDTLGNNIVLNSPNGELTININKKVTVNTVDVTVNAQNSVTVNTQETTVNTSIATVNASSSVNINTPQTNISNNTTIGGNLTVSGTISANNGTMTASGGTVTASEFVGPLQGNAATATYASSAG
jgi:phage baseplate assembly protein gpV